MINPFQFKAALAGVVVALLAIAGLTAWAFYERSRYFDCRATVAPLVAQVNVLAGKIDDQSAAIEAQGEAGAAAVKHGAQLLAEVRRGNGKHAGQLEQLAEIVKRPTPTKPDGTAKGCSDLWLEWQSEAKK